jgi:hypothetical protein
MRDQQQKYIWQYEGQKKICRLKVIFKLDV